MKIIVARYNENIEWTKQFENVIVYNKGKKLEDNYNEIMLDNVGREGHTYYKYIYDNYDNLDDYTIFLQGNPFDHSPNLISNINKYLKNEYLYIHFEFLSEWKINCNLSGCRYHYGLPLKAVYENLFNEKKENMSFEFGAGAQFIVSKKQILKRNKNFYLKIIKLLEKSVNPIEGFVIERFHKLIFSDDCKEIVEEKSTVVIVKDENNIENNENNDNNTKIIEEKPNNIIVTNENNNVIIIENNENLEKNTETSEKETIIMTNENKQDYKLYNLTLYGMRKHVNTYHNPIVSKISRKMNTMIFS